MSSIDTTTQCHSNTYSYDRKVNDKRFRDCIKENRNNPKEARGIYFLRHINEQKRFIIICRNYI